MAAAHTTFLTSAEAAFIAGVTDREVNRVIDEHIVPEPLLSLVGGRRVARLGAVFISFYFKTETLFTAQLRRNLVASLAGEMRAKESWPDLLELQDDAFSPLSRWLGNVQPKEAPYLHVDIWPFLQEAKARTEVVERALDHIKTDSEILNGTPVFKGTRVPIEGVLASLDAGVDLSRLQKSYPFLDEELVESARVYAKVRPRRGRPRRISEMHPSWKVKSSKVVRPAQP